MKPLSGLNHLLPVSKIATIVNKHYIGCNFTWRCFFFACLVTSKWWPNKVELWRDVKTNLVWMGFVPVVEPVKNKQKRMQQLVNMFIIEEEVLNTWKQRTAYRFWSRNSTEKKWRICLWRQWNFDCKERNYLPIAESRKFACMHYHQCKYVWSELETKSLLKKQLNLAIISPLYTQHSSRWGSRHVTYGHLLTFRRNSFALIYFRPFMTIPCNHMFHILYLLQNEYDNASNLVRYCNFGDILSIFSSKTTSAHSSRWFHCAKIGKELIYLLFKENVITS